MNDDGIPVPLAFIIAIAVAGCLFLVGLRLGERGAHRAAVKAGVAEYRATPEGDVTFHWKEPAK